MTKSLALPASTVTGELERNGLRVGIVNETLAGQEAMGQAGQGDPIGLEVRTAQSGRVTVYAARDRLDIGEARSALAASVLTAAGFTITRTSGRSFDVTWVVSSG